jgi:hypothetical protein
VNSSSGDKFEIGFDQLDRGWGRSETTANVKLPRDIRDLSTDELLAIIAKDAGAGAEIGDGNHGAPH